MEIMGIIIVVAAMLILFGLIGYILLGVLAVFAFGMAMVFLPIIMICGLGGILALVSRA